MKKIIFVVYFMLVGVLAHAQDAKLSTQVPIVETESESRHHAILEVGYIGSTSTAESDLVQHGFSGGFVFDLFGQSYFNFETGLFATQQSYSYASPNLASVDKNDLSSFADRRVSGKVFYVGVPLLAKLNLAGRVTNTPFIIAGVLPQFAVSKEITVRGSDTAGNSQYFKSQTDILNPPDYDIAGIVGLGGSFRFSSNQTILIQATYNRGFVAIDNLNHDLYSPIYNQSFLLTLGFGVDL